MDEKKNDKFNPTENLDKVGTFNDTTWKGGSGVGSSSNVNKLARDYVNSNYDSFTKGDDYASLAKRYSDQGRQAMDDTLGRVSARTGGLASSYATSAGQQAYGSWMEKLEDAARSLYDSQRADKLSNLNVAQGLNDRDRANFESDRSFNYGVYRDDVEDAKWKDNEVNEQNRWQSEMDTEAADKQREEEETNLYAEIYFGGTADYNAYKTAEGTLDEKTYNRIVKQAKEDKTNKDTEKSDKKTKEAQEDVMALWASGGTPTEEQLGAAGWYNKDEEDGISNIGKAYKHQATYTEPVLFWDTNDGKFIREEIDARLESGEDLNEYIGLLIENDFVEEGSADFNAILDYLVMKGFDYEQAD